MTNLALSHHAFASGIAVLRGTHPGSNNVTRKPFWDESCTHRLGLGCALAVGSF